MSADESTDWSRYLLGAVSSGEAVRAAVVRNHEQVQRLRDELAEALDRLGTLESGERCCPDACNGGACETCPCCCAGWCVRGRDGVPEHVDDLPGWMEVAAEHNPIVAAWARDRARIAELERLTRP